MGSLGTIGASWKQRPTQDGIIWVTHRCLRDSTRLVLTFYFLFCVSVTKDLLCQLVYWFTALLSFSPHNSPVRKELLLSSLCEWGNWGTGRQSHLPQVIQLVSGWTSGWTLAAWQQNLCYYTTPWKFPGSLAVWIQREIGRNLDATISP